MAIYIDELKSHHELNKFRDSVILDFLDNIKGLSYESRYILDNPTHFRSASTTSTTPKLKSSSAY